MVLPECRSRRHFTAKSDLQKLEDMLKTPEDSHRSAWTEADLEAERAEEVRRPHTATKSHITRKKKRAALGPYEIASTTLRLSAGPSHTSADSG